MKNFRFLILLLVSLVLLATIGNNTLRRHAPLAIELDESAAYESTPPYDNVFTSISAAELQRLGEENRRRLGRERRRLRRSVVTSIDDAVRFQSQLDDLIASISLTRRPRDVNCRTGFCASSGVDVCRSLSHAPPLPSLLAPPPPDCVRMAADFVSIINHSQNQCQCVQIRTAEGAGLGHELFSVARETAAATVAANCTFVPALGSARGWTSEWFCGSVKEEGSQSLLCYFESLGNETCRVDVTGASDTCVQSSTLSSSSSYSRRCLRGFDPFAYRWHWSAPSTLSFASMSSVWLFSQTLAYIWRHLSPATKQFIDIMARDCNYLRNNGQDRLDWSNFNHRLPCISMHFRSTDACAGARVDNRLCIESFSTLFSRATSLFHSYQLNHVFLATDNETVARECRDVAAPVTCSVIAFNRSLLDPQVYGADKIEQAPSASPQWPQSKLALATLADIDLMSRCTAFAGSFTSTIDRNVFGLMMARNYGRVPPYLSIEDETKADFNIFNTYF